MRLFVAIDLPEAVQSALTRLRESLDPAGNRARWVQPGSIHLTLKFLGEVDAGLVGSIETALVPIRARELLLKIGGIGFFPSSRRPRILWAGVSSDGLAALASEVQGAMRSIGFPHEEKPFHPHLTLARAPRKGTIDREIVRAAGELGETDFGSFSAGSFFLYRSRLNPRGAIYEKMLEFVFERTS